LDKLQLRGFEFAKAVTLVVEPFSVENGLLTPTMKVNLIALSLTPCFVHLPMGKVIVLSTHHPFLTETRWKSGFFIHPPSICHGVLVGCQFTLGPICFAIVLVSSLQRTSLFF
jgi:hypothetical protein